MTPKDDTLKEAMTAADEALTRPDPAALTTERGNVHGPADMQFSTAQMLRGIIRWAANMRREHGFDEINPIQLEALEMDAVKTSRILWGDPDHSDHWDDKMGYSYLGKTKGQNG